MSHSVCHILGIGTAGTLFRQDVPMTTEKPSPVQEAQTFVRGLLDVRSGLSGGMLEIIYRLVFLIAFVPWAAFTVLAFQEWSVFWGLVVGLVLGPALYVVLVVGMRIGLGFAVMLMKLMEQLSLMPAAVDRLSDRVDDLRLDLGKSVDDLNTRIDSFQDSLESAQFWRSSRRRRSSRPGADEVTSSEQPVD